jgi:hypothetical protein
MISKALKKVINFIFFTIQQLYIQCLTNYIPPRIYTGETTTLSLYTQLGKNSNQKKWFISPLFLCISCTHFRTLSLPRAFAILTGSNSKCPKNWARNSHLPSQTHHQVQWSRQFFFFARHTRLVRVESWQEITSRRLNCQNMEIFCCSIDQFHSFWCGLLWCWFFSKFTLF